jgi:hypothetical protein
VKIVKQGDLLRKIAQEAGFKSAMKLADTIKVSRSTVNDDFQKNELTDTVLEKYYKILGFTYSDFLQRFSELVENSPENEWKNIAKEYKFMFEKERELTLTLQKLLMNKLNS